MSTICTKHAMHKQINSKEEGNQVECVKKLSNGI